LALSDPTTVLVASSGHLDALVGRSKAFVYPLLTRAQVALESIPLWHTTTHTDIQADRRTPS